MSPDKLIELRTAFGDIFVQAYTSTEAPGVVSALLKRLHRSGSEDERRRLTSAGLPTTGVELKIVNSAGREAALDEAGEIWIRHRGVISRYWSNPEQTAKEFIDGWWVSGDIGRIDAEGFLHQVVRTSGGGFRIKNPWIL